MSLLNTGAFEATEEQIDRAAYLLFRKNVDDYENDEGLVLVAWADPAISGFWVDQVKAVLAALVLSE